MHMKFPSVLIQTGILFLVANICAGEWPRFRGPNGDGIVTESKAPREWGDDNVRWKTQLPGPGSSSPIVFGNRVFLTAYSGYGSDPSGPGDQSDLKRHALCYDLATGELLWQKEVPNEQKVADYTGRYITVHGYSSSSPVTDGEMVYFFLETSGVFAFTMDGEQVWQADVGEKSHAWGAGASPILHENLVIVNASAESDRFIALDKKTGEEIWSVTGMPRAWNTPLIVRPSNGDPELVVSIRGKILAFDPATGEALWNCEGIKAAELCPSPVEGDGILFILGHPRGEAMAVRPGGRGDVTESHVVWKLNKGSNVGSPVYHDGKLYWANDKSGIFYCVDGKSGEILYEHRMQPRPGMFYASPILIEDQIYYLNRNGETSVVAASPDFELIERHSLSGDNSPFNGSPAVVDDRVVIRSDRYLYCLGPK